MKLRGRLERGCIVNVGGDIWYIVAEILLLENGKVSLNCICDHAINIMNFDASHVIFSMTPAEAAEAGWGMFRTEQIQDAVGQRGIPYEQILEVVTGKHDHRFAHWERA